MNSTAIKNIRKGLNLSQEKFSELLNVSFTTVNRWENGKSKPTGQSKNTLTLLAEASKKVANDPNKLDVSSILSSVGVPLAIGAGTFLLYKLLKNVFEPE